MQYVTVHTVLMWWAGSPNLHLLIFIPFKAVFIVAMGPFGYGLGLVMRWITDKGA